MSVHHDISGNTGRAWFYKKRMKMFNLSGVRMNSGIQFEDLHIKYSADSKIIVPSSAHAVPHSPTHTHHNSYFVLCPPSQTTKHESRMHIHTLLSLSLSFTLPLTFTGTLTGITEE